MTPAPERPDTVNRSKPVYGLTGRMREKRGLPDDGVSGAAVTPAPERPDLDAAWKELLLDACASDGPIRDADVKTAIARYRPKIEALAAAPVTDAGLREALFDGVMELGCRHTADFAAGLIEPGECLIEVDRVLGVIEDVLASRQAEKETA